MDRLYYRECFELSSLRTLCTEGRDQSSFDTQTMPIRDENPKYKHINEGLKPGGLTYNVELAPLAKCFKIHFRSCSTDHMFIGYVCFYCIFVKFMQFPVLGFGLVRSGSLACPCNCTFEPHHIFIAVNICMDYLLTYIERLPLMLISHVAIERRVLRFMFLAEV